MRFQITARYGHRYHLIAVEADDAGAALRRAADLLPAELLPHIDLVELRVAVDPDDRPVPSDAPGGPSGPDPVDGPG